MQPLVENAIRHGVEPAAERVSVRVQARQANGRLTLAVEDDGPGLSPDGSPNGGAGIGLGNARVHLAESAQGGLRVEIEIPYRRESSEDAV